MLGTSPKSLGVRSPVIRVIVVNYTSRAIDAKYSSFIHPRVSVQYSIDRQLLIGHVYSLVFHSTHPASLPRFA